MLPLFRISLFIVESFKHNSHYFAIQSFPNTNRENVRVFQRRRAHATQYRAT